MHFRFHFLRLRKCILHVILIIVRLRNYRGMFLKHEIKAEAQNAGVRFLASDTSLVASFKRSKWGRSCAEFDSRQELLEKFMAENIYGNCDLKL